MTFVDGLLWLGSAAGVAAVAAVSSFVLERSKAFQAMSSVVKLIVSVTAATMIGIVGVFAADLLPKFPVVMSALERAWPVFVVGLSIITQQLAHGNRKATKVVTSAQGKGG